jgi:hypothetical protein
MSRSDVLRRLEHLHAMLEHVAPESAATVREAIEIISGNQGWHGSTPSTYSRGAAPHLAKCATWNIDRSRP